MGKDLMQKIATSIGRQCKPGTIVITTDYMLPLTGPILSKMVNDYQSKSESYELEIVQEVEGWCWLTGGASTAYIHRVTKRSH